MLLGHQVIGTIGILAGLPAVLTDFAWSLLQLVQYNQEYLCEHGQTIHYSRSTVSFHSFARNSLVEQMKGDWLLQLDADHAFEPDLAVRLLSLMNRHDLDVLVGLYQYKTPPYSPVIYQWRDDSDFLSPIGDWDREVSAFQVGSSGAGCLMVRRRVFDRIRDELHEGPFDILHPLGEDHSFFKRLRTLGIAAYCAPRIECPHLRVHGITLQEFTCDAMEIDSRVEVQGFQ